MTGEDTQIHLRRALERVERQFRAVLHTSPDAYYLYDQDGHILDVNEEACKCLGYTREELLNLNLADIDREFSLDHARQMWRKMPTGATEVLRTTHWSKNGQSFPVEVRVHVISDFRDAMQVMALARDLRGQVRGDKARDVLVTLGRKLSELATPRQVGIVILDAADELFSWDAAFIDLYDPHTNQSVTLASYDLIAGERAEVQPRFTSPPAGSVSERAIKDGPQLVLRQKSQLAEVSSIRIGDQSRPSASLMFVPIRHSEKAIGLISVQSYNVNAYDQEDLRLLEALAEYGSGAFQRALTQDRLREAEQRFATAFENAPIGQGLLTPAGDWVRVNHALTEMLGYSEKELLATGLHGITYYDDLSRSLDELLSVYAGEQDFTTFEIRLIHRSRKHVWVSFRASLIRDAGGAPLYLIVQLQDITANRRYQQVACELQDLGQKLVEATTQREVARYVLSAADRLFGFDAAFVDLVDEDDASKSIVQIDTIEGVKQEIEPLAKKPQEGTISRRTLLEGAQLILREEQVDPGETLTFGAARLSLSLMYVPVRRDLRNVGVLSLQSYQADAYNADDLKVLQELADFCSTAFERAYAEMKAAEAEEALRETQRRFESVMRATSDTVYDWDLRTGDIWWSDSMHQMFGYVPSKEHDLAWWKSRIHPEDHEEVTHSLHSSIAKGATSWSGEYRFQRSDGTYAVVFDRGLVQYSYAKPVRMIGSMMDITQRKRAEEELRHGAYHDALTGLPNRTYLLKELEHSLARCRRHPEARVGLLFLDLDSFKEVNDTLGHAAGDQLLEEVARSLRHCVRPSDFVARLGGDEFTVILNDLQTRDDAIAVAERILQRLQQPFHLMAGKVHTGGSIGVVMNTTTHTSPTGLLSKADEAMYRAKSSGKNRYEVLSD